MAGLNNSMLERLPAGIGKPAYDRRKVTAGIAHLSVGNFHRAHQAVYLDRCLSMEGQEGWGILGIGLVDSPAERAKAASLTRQDGLYTLSVFPPEGEPGSEVIGSIVDYLFAPANPALVLERLSDPAIRIVTMTITEGGYNIDDKTGAFRLDAPEIVADLARPDAPATMFGVVTAALERRRKAGVPPFTMLSCDNLQNNGEVAKKAILAFAGARSRELADWIAANVAFPSCMVDRITPAVLPEDVRRLNALTGIADEAPVFAEDFIQWVVEDHFPSGRPKLEAVGVQFTDDVKPYEQIKLRMLNSSHLMLSYPGQVGGYRFVHEAMADERIMGLLRSFLDKDVIPLLSAPADMPLERYRDIVLARFANPAINDQNARLTSDSTSKIPVFLSETIRQCLEGGRDHRRLAFLLAGYAHYLGGADDRGQRFEPIEPKLEDADRALASDPDPAAPLRISTLRFLELDAHPGFVQSFVGYRKAIAEKGILPALADLLAEPG
ncbi:mannitol dehydrogenase family protein [Geminicoccus harenae]|uniref:mannitol dehydrogenase family protein n=1 Tax=Geminicoccus harenae TaxID=2498453 RepID=UPI00168B8AB9|nr:mannitol dehydrogenase family protein [Geminicoccus harenae]